MFGLLASRVLISCGAAGMILAFSSLRLEAQTIQVFPPITRYVQDGSPQYEQMYINAQPCPAAPSGNFRDCAPPTGGTIVYTAASMDSQFAGLKVTNAQLITTQVTAAQAQLEADVKTALDALPQSLLSQAAKDDIKAQIMAELKPQLDAMQQQIDSLKALSPHVLGNQNHVNALHVSPSRSPVVAPHKSELQQPANKLAPVAKTPPKP